MQFDGKIQLWNSTIFLVKILGLIFETFRFDGKIQLLNLTIFRVKIVGLLRKIKINKCHLTEKFQLLEFDNFSHKNSMVNFLKHCNLTEKM